jgi:hypothetical protein
MKGFMKPCGLDTPLRGTRPPIIEGVKYLPMAKYKILYWKGIPSQVRASDEQGRVNKPLPERFQLAIDEAAMALGLSGSDAYTDGFVWGEELEHPGTAEEAADAIAAELDKKYPSVDWRALVQQR